MLIFLAMALISQTYFWKGDDLPMLKKEHFVGTHLCFVLCTVKYNQEIFLFAGKGVEAAYLCLKPFALLRLGSQHHSNTVTQRHNNTVIQQHSNTSTQ